LSLKLSDTEAAVGEVVFVLVGTAGSGIIRGFSSGDGGDVSITVTIVVAGEADFVLVGTAVLGRLGGDSV
jgi:hypothetical protein